MQIRSNCAILETASPISILQEELLEDEDYGSIPFGYFYEPYDLPTDFPVYLQYFDVQSDAAIVQLHTHNVMELGYCHRGNGVFNIRDRFWTFGAGDVSVISRDEVHYAQARKGTESPWSFLFLDIDALIMPHYPESLDSGLTRFGGRDFSNIISGEEHPRISGIMESLIRELREERVFYRLNVISLIAQLMVELQRLFPQEGLPAEEEGIDSLSLDRIAPALHHMQRRYGDKISVAELASLCYMSPRTFTRQFGRIFRKSPLEFLLEQRLALACNQLKNTDRPVSLVAESCGFLSLSSFNRHFKARFGRSPREWRKEPG